MISFRDIEYILAAARLKTFSAAAAYCRVSQPSLSVQIKNVEDWLGNKIFIRQKTGLEITPFGAALIPLLENVQTQFYAIKELAAQTPHRMKDKFWLGVIPTVAPYLLPQLIKKWSNAMPQVEIILQEAITEDLLKNMMQGKLDGVLLSLSSAQLSPYQKKIISYEVMQDDFLLAASKTSPLLKSNHTSEQILANHGDKLILLHDEHCLTGEVKIICQQGAKKLSPFRATSLETIRHLLLVEDRLTVIPNMARKQDDGLSYMPFNPQYYRTIGLVIPKLSNKKKMAEQLVRTSVANNRPSDRENSPS